MKQYIQALEHILEKGKQRDDRTGVEPGVFLGTKCALILETVIATTKRLAWKSVVSELFGF